MPLLRGGVRMTESMLEALASHARSCSEEPPVFVGHRSFCFLQIWWVSFGVPQALFLCPFGVLLVAFTSSAVSVGSLWVFFRGHGDLGAPPGSILLVVAPCSYNLHCFIDRFAVGSLVRGKFRAL